MFDGIFRAQLTEDKIGTVSLPVRKAPWNFICSKGRHNSWVLMVKSVIPLRHKCFQQGGGGGGGRGGGGAMLQSNIIG